MKMKLLTISVVIAAVTALGQNGVVQDVKHGAKKTGETIKDGLETVGEKTKETAKTVGKKTKETVETVGEKTKEAGQTVARKTKESVRGEEASETTGKSHHRPRSTSGKPKAQNTEEQPADHQANTPAASPGNR